MDVKEFIEPILNNALPGVNAAISDGIKSAGLDPWKDVLSESIPLGKIPFKIF